MKKLSNIDEAANKPTWGLDSEVCTYAFTNKEGYADTVRVELNYDGSFQGKTSMMVFHNNRRIDELDSEDIGQEDGDKQDAIDDVRAYVESNI